MAEQENVVGIARSVGNDTARAVIMQPPADIEKPVESGGKIKIRKVGDTVVVAVEEAESVPTEDVSTESVGALKDTDTTQIEDTGPISIEEAESVPIEDIGIKSMKEPQTVIAHGQINTQLSSLSPWDNAVQLIQSGDIIYNIGMLVKLAAMTHIVHKIKLVESIESISLLNALLLFTTKTLREAVQRQLAHITTEKAL